MAVTNGEVLAIQLRYIKSQFLRISEDRTKGDDAMQSIAPRRSGKTKLVYDKATRTIVAVAVDRLKGDEMSPIEPSFDRVVLREDTPEEITTGGIVIPSLAQEKTKTARVIATGPECKFFAVGDHVVHNKFAGTDLELDRITYTIVAECELLGRLPVVLA